MDSDFKVAYSYVADWFGLLAYNVLSSTPIPKPVLWVNSKTEFQESFHKKMSFVFEL